MVEDALKEKEQVFTQTCSNVLKSFYLAIFFFWFQLESDYEKYKKDAENEIEKLTAKNAANSESEDLPWETDPELRDMTAVELRAILADDLTGILLCFFSVRSNFCSQLCFFVKDR